MTQSESAAQHESAPASEKRPPRREVVEETRETLDLMRLERTPRDEKLAMENARLTDAAEVHFTERSVALKDTDVESVRARIDALAVHEEKRPLPEARPPPPAPEPAPEPEPEAPQAELTPKERAALEKKVGAPLVRVDTLYKTSAGHAVEVTFEKDGRTRTSPYILRNGEAADLEELGRVLDQIPLPELPQPAAAPETDAPVESQPESAPADAPAAEPAAPEAAPEGPADAAAAEPVEEKPKKKGLFGRRKKGEPEKAEAPETPDAKPDAKPDEPTEDAVKAPKKKLFGRKKEAKEQADASAAEAEKPKRMRFGLKKKEAAPADTDASAAGDASADASADAAEGDAADAAPAKKKRFGFRRK